MIISFNHGNFHDFPKNKRLDMVRQYCTQHDEKPYLRSHHIM